ncbi:DNA/RNA non-specific endonuclease [Alteromonas stellipolaris]|jgi:endonuclease G|uniref:DNA/RNA non-specific endonuclease n=1 Tax=Alteromonas stellipolaris TaxID=233316 RepID=UPI001DAA2DA8|nr:DNA/RNA non-specific endonuclease [Alteromonas stellipolaris]MBZ2163271.1 endonuclease G [Alteromonas stellipolaris]
MLKKILFIGTTLLLTSYVHAESGCEKDKSQWVLTPETTSDFCFTDYSLSYSTVNELPLQVSYWLSPTQKQSANPFNLVINSDKFVPSTFNREEAAHKTGFDFVALAPIALTKINRHERYYDLNRVPVEKTQNRAGGAWFELNKLEVEKLLNIGRLLVINGVVTVKNDYKPTHLYKILYQPEINMAAAFLVPNDSENHTITSTITSISCIEQKLGYPLLGTETLIPESLKQKVAYSKNVWADVGAKSYQCEEGTI